MPSVVIERCFWGGGGERDFVSLWVVDECEFAIECVFRVLRWSAFVAISRNVEDGERTLSALMWTFGWKFNGWEYVGNWVRVLNFLYAFRSN